MASGTLLQCPQFDQTVSHVPGLNCQRCLRTVPVISNLRVNRTACQLRWQVPSSLRSSAAGYARRWALPVATRNNMEGPSVLCPSSRAAARARRIAGALRRALIREVLTVGSFPRAPHRVPAGNARKVVNHHRPATARARAADTLCSSDACSSRRSALKERMRFGEGRASVLGRASELMALLVPVPSSTAAHTAIAVLPSTGAVSSAAPNPRFERTRSGGLRQECPDFCVPRRVDDSLGVRS
jgi:hypothetical protein